MKKTIIALSMALGLLQTLQAQTFTIEVKVIQSQPLYRMVTIRTPHQECWDEQVQMQNNNNNYPIGTIIGGVAGGVLGHQIGKGRGKKVATIGGAILGSIVGHNLSNTQSTQGYKTIRRCKTEYSERQEERFVGYKNIADFQGRTIIKISDRKLQYIPIVISY